ncbi:MAG: alpha-1,2-fucosyltransferase [Acholeplasma sp.]|nr:alpha-1,2-fucosyltransferase [Acholeplasma sp.]
MIIKLKAGLGNQMFQYALGVLLKEQYGVETVKYDYQYITNYRKKWKLSSVDNLNTKLSYATREEKKRLLADLFIPHTFLYRLSVFVDKTFHRHYYFEKNRKVISISTLINYNYIDGYWQSYKYVDSIRNILLQDFKNRHPLDKSSIDFLHSIQNLNIVMVGIRLGDYISEHKHYYQCDNNYYNLAMDLISSKVKNPIFLIFSNNVELCKKNFKFKYEVIYRENKDYVNDYDELQIMRECKHAIIGNSTFHWWGAWLIENDDKIVVRPPLWFADGSEIDIFPNDWLTI